MFATACAVLATEIILTRVYSVLMWYHFAFMAICVCLFGLGAGSLVVQLTSHRLRDDDLPRHLGRATLGFAWSQMLAVVVLRSLKLGSLNLDATSLIQMGTAFALTALPFGFAGAFFALVFSRGSENIGRYYWADLTGAAAGCLITIWLLGRLGGEAALAATGLAALAAGLLVTWRAHRTTFWAQAASMVVIAAVLVANHGYGFFSFHHTKGNDEPDPVATAWNSFSRVIAYPRTDIGDIMLVIDGIAFTPITPFRGDAEATQDDMALLQRVPYAFYDEPSALIIGSGGGEHILTALAAGSKRVVGVEMNPIVIDMVERRFADLSGGLFHEPGVTVELAEGRSFIARTRDRFDVLNFTLIDTWAATAGGAFSLTENYLFTRNAFNEYFDHLTPRGMLAVKRWRDAPEYIHRTAALARSVLEERGIQDAGMCFFVVANDEFANILVKPSGFDVPDVTRLEEMAARYNLKILYAPYWDRYDETLQTMLRTTDFPGWLRQQTLDYSPPTDNRPFFFYTLRPSDLARTFSLPYAAKIRNVGALIVFATLGLVAAYLAATILGPPLFVKKYRYFLGGNLRAAAYFALIGIGFLTVEVSVMQSFILYLGHPTLTLSVFLSTLFVSSGAGSGLSSRLGRVRPRHTLILAVIALIGTALAILIVSPRLFAATLGLSTAARSIITAAVIAPLGLLMGLFFPFGVRAVGEDGTVPWMFAVNSAASVLGSVAAMAVALVAGFSATVTVGLLAYALAAFVYPARDE